MLNSVPFCFQEIIPFAVVGSNTLLEVNGKRVRGRLYPWGVVEGKGEGRGGGGGGGKREGGRRKEEGRKEGRGTERGRRD